MTIVGQHHRRPAFRLVELLTLIAIIFVATVLLLSAIQESRERANRANCQSNMRQLAIAINNYDATYKRLPDPAIAGKVQGTGFDGTTLFIQLMPFIESDHNYETWQTYQGTADFVAHGASPNVGLSMTYPLFRCPSDSSVDKTAKDACSYCTNVAAFNPTMQPDRYTGTVGATVSLRTIPAGTSSVIAFAEMIYNCRGALNQIDMADSNTSFWVDISTSTAPPVFVRQNSSTCGGRLASGHIDAMNVISFDGHVRTVPATASSAGNNFGLGCNPKKGYAGW